MNTIARILPVGLMAMPLMVAGQNLGWIASVVGQIKTIVALLVPLVIALAFIVFVWGLITFILASGDEAAKEEGKRRMIWGVIALFIIVSIWGIIRVLQNLTDTAGGKTTYPTWPA